MGLRQYQLGKKHALNGIRRMSHRKNERPYDSSNARESYNQGYSQGLKEKRAEENPLSFYSWLKISA